MEAVTKPLVGVQAVSETDGKFKRGRPGQCLLPAGRLQQLLPCPELDTLETPSRVRRFHQ